MTAITLPTLHHDHHPLWCNMRNQKIHLITSTSETENQKDPCHKWYMRIQKPKRTHASVSHAWMIDSNLILNPIHCLLLSCIIEPFEKTVNPKPILNLSDCTITPVTSQWVECINKLDMLWNLNHILNRITYFLKVNPCLTWHAIQSYTTCKWCPLFSWQMKGPYHHYQTRKSGFNARERECFTSSRVHN
jgi:hypothetical protein